MRTPTITTSLDDSCDPPGWRAELVDPSGWLAGAGGTTSSSRAFTDPVEGRPAGPMQRRTTRAGRRSNARRRRRVHPPAASRSLVVDHAVAPDPSPLPAAVQESVVDGYRMGRWARLTLTVTALAAIAVVTVSLLMGSAPQAVVDVTVGPGDTLWSIATQAAPDRDPRDVIDEIRALNNVPDALPIGIVLRVPASAG